MAIIAKKFQIFLKILIRINLAKFMTKISKIPYSKILKEFHVCRTQHFIGGFRKARR